MLAGMQTERSAAVLGKEKSDLAPRAAVETLIRGLTCVRARACV